MGDPGFQDRIKYITPGEFAGKRTFKELLVNDAAEPHNWLLNTN